MRWYLKVAAFQILSVIPGGARLYRFSQDYITKGLIPSRVRVRMKMDIGCQYWTWLKEHRQTGLLKDGTHLDFGSGWHPTIPLLYYSFGVRHQYLLDVVSLLNASLVADTTRVVREIVTDPDWPHCDELVRLPDPVTMRGNEWEKWLESLGIEYLAPYLGRTQELIGTIDVVTSTQALLHIDSDNLLTCFRMLREALRPGGLFFATVHLKDLYANTDPHITPYNHLKFSPWWWENMVDTKLMPFNRLKARDYRELLERAGFIVEAFDVEGPTAADLQQLDTVRVHRCFAGYSREELGAKHLFFVARKP